VVVLGVLIFVHELGHYLAARWRGVHVERFSIGFGPRIAAWTDQRGCEWRIGWIPLGGYVKMHGMEHPTDTCPRMAACGRARASTRSRGRPAPSVVAAGPFFNFLLAALLFAAIFATYGQPTAAVSDRPEDQLTVQAVVRDSPAAQAGLRRGDRILTLDGTPMQRFADLQAFIESRPNQPVAIEIRRGGTQLTLQATPAAREDGRGRLGVQGGGAVVRERLNPLSALRRRLAHGGGLRPDPRRGMADGHRRPRRRGDRRPAAHRPALRRGGGDGAGLHALLHRVLSINLALITCSPSPSSMAGICCSTRRRRSAAGH